MATATQAPDGFVSSRSAYHGPDPQRAQHQLQMIQALYRNVGPTEFAQRCFWIIRKNPEKGERDILPSDSRFWNRRLVPFVHNRIQRDLDNKIIVNDSKRNILLKPRQAGYTTWTIIMRLLMPSILSPGTGSMLISQNAEYAAAHFGILKLAYRRFMEADPYDNSQNDWAIGLRQHLLHVVYSNRRELVFDQLESRVRCASAEVEETGQGFTIQHLVATEVSRWEGNPEETLANAKEAVPVDGTLDIECTPNGRGGYFYEEWQRSRNPPPGKDPEFMPHFHTWWWHDEYRKEPAIPIEAMDVEERALMVAHHLDGGQIAWRRAKKLSLRHNFDEKYPEDEINCLSRGAVVLLPNGKTATISSLVAKRYKGNVLSVDAKGRIVEKRVIGWHRSKRAGRQLFRLIYEYGKSAHGMRVGVTATAEHKVLTDEGWRRIDQCDGLKVATGTPKPGPRAWQVLMGTVLGDAHVGRRHIAIIQCCDELVRLKGQVLSAFSPNVRRARRCSGMQKIKPTILTTKSYPFLSWLRAKFYPEGKKVFPLDVVRQLDALGLAIWFMDYGWMNKAGLYESGCCHPSMRPWGGIHIGVISKSVGDRVAAILTQKGYQCRCSRVSGGRYRIIRFSPDGFISLCRDIAKYVPPTMRYKLLDGMASFDASFYESEEAKTFWARASVKKVPPEKQKGGRYEKSPVYCLDVEDTHNFVTNGGVVHNCFLMEGNAFFEKEILMLRYKELQNYVAYKVSNKTVIFKKPVRHRRYIIGVDVATGLPVTSRDPDFSAAVVIDQETGEEYASYRAHVLPEELAWNMAELGRMYNNAEIAVERNNEGGTVIMALKLAEQYGNIYTHKDWWKRDWQNTKLIEGFMTTQKTRPIALNRIRWFVAESPHLIYDIKFVEEAMSFMREEKKGRPEAIKGAHDDTVMCRAIAHYVRAVRLGYLDPSQIKEAEKYGDDPTEFQEPEDQPT